MNSNVWRTFNISIFIQSQLNKIFSVKSQLKMLSKANTKFKLIATARALILLLFIMKNDFKKMKECPQNPEPQS